ncbi:MAG: hypothetical protein SGJ11_00840 [Phycisphaerae bacterium]|nr:hypothetical protein [Phycisphaerae bacterium]
MGLRFAQSMEVRPTIDATSGAQDGVLAVDPTLGPWSDEDSCVLRSVMAWRLDPKNDGRGRAALLVESLIRDAHRTLWAGEHFLHATTLWERFVEKNALGAPGLRSNEPPVLKGSDTARPGERVRPLITGFEGYIDGREQSFVTVVSCDAKIPGVTQLFRLRMKYFGFALRIDEHVGLDRRGRTSVRHVMHLEVRTDSDSLVTFNAKGSTKLGGRSLLALNPLTAGVSLWDPMSLPLHRPYERADESSWRSRCIEAGWSDDELTTALAPSARLRHRPLR